MRLAVVQPLWQHRDERALDDAERLARQAAAGGARLVLFPEAYPGPAHATDRFEGTAERMAALASELGVHLAWGSLEPATSSSPGQQPDAALAASGFCPGLQPDARWSVVHHVNGPDGDLLVRYPRAHPATGDVHPVLNGTGVAPGHGLATFVADGVTVGLLVCSELWLPEVARVLALRGAEVILAPAGGGFTGVARNWELIAQARALENECFVGLTVSRFGTEEGSALIAGPEGLLARATHDELVIADLDLDRARWLRDRDDSMEEPKTFAALPGLLRARRPELYGELSAPAGPDAYDYEAHA